MRPENLEKVMSMSREERKARRQAVLRDYNSGMTCSQIADKYDVSYQTAYIYLRRENYIPKYFGQRTKDAKRFESGILQLKELFSQDPPSADDSTGLLQLLIQAREIVRSF